MSTAWSGGRAGIAARASRGSGVGATTRPGPPTTQWSRSRNLFVVVLLGAAITTSLAFGAVRVRDHTEAELLGQRTREAAAVLQASVPTVELPLSAGATLAESTTGDVALFRREFASLAGAHGRFVSVSLWRAAPPYARPMAVVGGAPELSTVGRVRERAFLDAARAAPSLFVVDLLTATDRRLGYAVTTGSRTTRYVVYAEQALPRSGRVGPRDDGAFAGLGYALYLGPRETSSSLVYASEGDRLPIAGRRATVDVPFGNTHLLLVMTPHVALSGSLMQRLPWILAVGGAIVTLLALALTDRLVRRRMEAVRYAAELDVVAGENAQLYERQREVAETLQHSLLPGSLPRLRGVVVAGRYVAGTKDLEIGGDWYDVIELDRDALMLVIGDVSGRGVGAATVMARLRYAASAYAVAGDAPHEVLDKLARLLDVRDGYFATVLCARLDVDRHDLVVANAGHLPAILATPCSTARVGAAVGVPIGVDPAAQYRTERFSIPQSGTLVLYTDGLVERRDVDPEVQVAKVVSLVAAEAATPVDAMVDRLLTEVVPPGAEDDTAILAVRWNR